MSKGTREELPFTAVRGASEGQQMQCRPCTVKASDPGELLG